MDDSRAWGIGADVVLPLPVTRRPNGPGLEAAAAVRTDISQHMRDTFGAEGAFEGANARILAVGRQRLAAVLANRP